MLPLNSTQIWAYFKGREKNVRKDPKWSPAYFPIINGIQNSEGRGMHYEWMGFQW